MIAAAGARRIVVDLQERPPDLQGHPDDFGVARADDLGQGLAPGVARRGPTPARARRRRRRRSIRDEPRSVSISIRENLAWRRPEASRASTRCTRCPHVWLTGRSSSAYPSAHARPTATIPTPSIAAALSLANGRRDQRAPRQPCVTLQDGAGPEASPQACASPRASERRSFAAEATPALPSARAVARRAGSPRRDRPVPRHAARGARAVRAGSPRPRERRRAAHAGSRIESRPSRIRVRTAQRLAEHGQPPRADAVEAPRPSAALWRGVAEGERR